MIDVAREDLATMMEAGYIYLGMQRFKESKAVFEGVAALAPDSEVPIIALGQVDFCEGRFKSAIAKYKKALKRDPSSVYAMAYMAEALFFDGKKQEAVKLLKEVVRLDGDGRPAAFAHALLDAIDNGFTPDMLSGVGEIRNANKRKKRD